ncbi:AAA family ATPase [Hafnia alvei]|jgi:predicted ATP-binding protein involved in virulence|uniref:AAA family ATPase n=1 Tax=Hafnia alvei TaxID=569 RepID=UPI001040B8EE|nr:AAA family ATPase [Hafnia alvei]QBJ31931.1 ATP-binding protein [Hafnia alvei]
MLGSNIRLDGLTGVGTVQLNLQENQRVYTLIGANGVGKTKTLEALFQILFFSNSVVEQNVTNHGLNQGFWRFNSLSGSASINFIGLKNQKMQPITVKQATDLFSSLRHNFPVVFLGSQNRGFIQHNASRQNAIGTLEQRRKEYFSQLIQGMETNFSNLNMNSGIEEWFVTLAKSANPYQKKEDNREIEIQTVMSLLNQLDHRIDREFMEISGDDRVSLKIDGQKRELTQLSSGFTSILKLIQGIISGYGYFTNESQLQNVKGVVLIDEIESHLHLSWQASIIPLLKKLFPNTTFYITTHSSVVLSQLKEGEAYQLARDGDGIVNARLIASPNKVALVDILKDAFEIDINQIKLENSSANEQKEAKARLLAMLKDQESK